MLLVKPVAERRTISKISLMIAVLLFLSQLYGYQYYFGINSHLLFHLLSTLFTVSIFCELLEWLPINHVENISLVFYLFLNGAATVGIVGLVYRKVFLNLFSIGIILLGMLLYMLSNLLHKASGIVEIGILSTNILDIFASPLTTILLIPAFKLYKQQNNR